MSIFDLSGDDKITMDKTGIDELSIALEMMTWTDEEINQFERTDEYKGLLESGLITESTLTKVRVSKEGDLKRRAGAIARQMAVNSGKYDNKLKKIDTLKKLVADLEFDVTKPFMREAEKEAKQSQRSYAKLPSFMKNKK